MDTNIIMILNVDDEFAREDNDIRMEVNIFFANVLTFDPSLSYEDQDTLLRNIPSLIYEK